MLPSFHYGLACTFTTEFCSQSFLFLSYFRVSRINDTQESMIQHSQMGSSSASETMENKPQEPLTVPATSKFSLRPMEPVGARCYARAASGSNAWISPYTSPANKNISKLPSLVDFRAESLTTICEADAACSNAGGADWLLIAQEESQWWEQELKQFSPGAYYCKNSKIKEIEYI
jgi:hypothetical protein